MSTCFTYLLTYLCVSICVYRLHGSFEALGGGLMSEALTDVTGGIVERFALGSKAPSNLQNIMLKAFEKSSLMGCSIDVSVSFCAQNKRTLKADHC